MNSSQPNRENAAGTDTTHSYSQPQTLANLTKFQTSILAVLAEEARYGLAIKDELEAYTGENVYHGRLYTNLGDLQDNGLIETSQLDKRTNEYALTDAGREAIRADVRWYTQRVNHTDSDGGGA